jgi:hypothetical protein
MEAVFPSETSVEFYWPTLKTEIVLANLCASNGAHRLQTCFIYNERDVLQNLFCYTKI